MRITLPGLILSLLVVCATYFQPIRTAKIPEYQRTKPDYAYPEPPYEEPYEEPCDKEEDCVENCYGLDTGTYRSCQPCFFVVCSNNQKFEKRCASGTSWDDNLKGCGIRDPNCEVTTHETTTPWYITHPTYPTPRDCSNGKCCVTSCADEKPGNYQSCQGCDVYVTCNHGLMYNLRCPDSTWWDDSVKRCARSSSTCHIGNTGNTATTPQPWTGTTVKKAPSCPGGDPNNCCVSDCKTLEDGDYQYCYSCESYITCTNGRLVGPRPCAPGGLVWDDYTKTCERTSKTCNKRDINECKNTALNNCCPPPAGRCVNTDDSYYCACNAGYSGDGRTCTDINECAVANNCDTNADCINSEGSYTCTCSEGYTGNGYNCEEIDTCKDNTCGNGGKCVRKWPGYECTCYDGYRLNQGKTKCKDIDECAEKTDCDSNAYCTNSEGSYTCTCNEGYKGNGYTCEEIDTCKGNTCGNGGKCVRKWPGYECTCYDGYRLNQDKTKCEDIDECAGTPDCDTNAYCTNSEGSYTCTCNEGYTGNGYTCEEIDTCKGNTCGNGGKCVRKWPGYECTCYDGYRLNQDKTKCEDIDECAGTPDCDTNAYCTNSEGSYTCTCNEGYTGNGYTCEEIDTCKGNTCGNGGKCVRKWPGYECTCYDGYRLNQDKTKCEDIDECAGTPDCDTNAYCTNSEGSYTCTCNEGYTGNGYTCEEIDTCKGNTCGNGGKCVRKWPGYECTCYDGYRLNQDKTKCEDIDECAGTPDCDTNAYCTNSEGSYTCTCNEGYTGNGYTCEEIDTCKGNTCGNGGKCVRKWPGYECTCYDGYRLNQDKTKCEDIDECAGTPDCDTNAYCTNSEGSYTCTCNEGYTGNAYTCEEIDTCKDSPCGDGGKCEIKWPGYECTCYDGYRLNQRKTKCEDIDECKEKYNKCGPPPSIKCTNTIGSYTCTCDEDNGYSGDGTSCIADRHICQDVHCSSSFDDHKQQCIVENADKTSAVYVVRNLANVNKCVRDQNFWYTSKTARGDKVSWVIEASNKCCADFKVCNCAKRKTFTCERKSGNVRKSLKCLNLVNADEIVAYINIVGGGEDICKFNTNMFVYGDTLWLTGDCQGTFDVCIVPKPNKG